MSKHACLAVGLSVALASSLVAQCSCPGPITNLTDSGGFLWDIDSNGTTCNGTSDAFDVGQALMINGVYFPPTSGPALELSGRQLVFGPQSMSGLNVTRRAYIPSGDRFGRWLEYLSNPTSGPINVTVRIENNPGSDGSTTVTATSSGDTSYTTADRWVNTDDFDGGGDPSLNHNFWGTGGSISASLVGMTVFDCAATNGPFAQFAVTVPAGRTVIIMHFAAQNANQASSLSNANTIDGLPPATLFGIAPADLASIINWAAGGTPPTGMPATSSTARLAMGGLLAAAVAALVMRRSAG